MLTPIRVVALLEAASVTGPAKNLIRFCKLAKAEGRASVSIAAFHRGGAGSAPPSSPLFDAIRAEGVDLDIVQERYRFDPSVIPIIREIALRRGADLIETHGVKSHFLVRFSGLQRRFRWIAFQHGYTAEDLKMRMYIKLDRWSLPAANRVVAVCRPFAEALARAGVRRERIHVLSNSIEAAPSCDTGKVRDLRQRLGIPDSARIILSIGRFSTEKAHADLLSAFLLLKQESPGLDVRLVLVGDGIERPRLERQAEASGLAGRVVFAGQQRDVWPFYGLADLFALPSLSEGSSNVLLEAMASGVPIVATSVGGVPETVEHESSALLVPPRSPAELAEAMRRVLIDPGLAAKLTAEASIRVRRFSPQAYCDKLIGIYQSVIETPAAVDA